MAGRDPGPGDDRVTEPPPPSPDHHHSKWRESVPWVWRHARKVVIGVIGGTVVLIGLALLLLPGPGSLVIILGLAILATEFAFAARWLRYAKERARAMAQYAHLRRHADAKRKEPDEPSPPEVSG